MPGRSFVSDSFMDIRKPRRLEHQMLPCSVPAVVRSNPAPRLGCSSAPQPTGVITAADNGGMPTSTPPLLESRHHRKTAIKFRITLRSSSLVTLATEIIKRWLQTADDMETSIRALDSFTAARSDRGLIPPSCLP